jgi:hypothetical protein
MEERIWQEINYDQAALLFTDKDNYIEACKCNFVAKQNEVKLKH